jgi:hypothetical protein
MKFFKKCDPIEYGEQVQWATEEENKRARGQEGKEKDVQAHRANKTQEDDKLRQQKHRQKRHEMEISVGKRTPGGTKCVRQVSILLLLNVEI